MAGMGPGVALANLHGGVVRELRDREGSTVVPYIAGGFGAAGFLYDDYYEGAPRVPDAAWWSKTFGQARLGLLLPPRHHDALGVTIEAGLWAGLFRTRDNGVIVHNEPFVQPTIGMGFWNLSKP